VKVSGNYKACGVLSALALKAWLWLRPLRSFHRTRFSHPTYFGRFTGTPKAWRPQRPSTSFIPPKTLLAHPFLGLINALRKILLPLVGQRCFCWCLGDFRNVGIDPVPTGSLPPPLHRVNVSLIGGSTSAAFSKSCRPMRYGCRLVRRVHQGCLLIRQRGNVRKNVMPSADTLYAA
jgi:hypothetical protein